MRVKVGGRIADDTGVSDQDDGRCPHCGALLRAGSPWCTLCFTDLRPAPEPVAVSAVREPSYAGAPAPSAETPASDPLIFDALTFDPLTAPLSVVEAGGQAVAADPAASTEVTKPTGWPCTRCDEIVSFDEAACPKCGTAFLAGATGQPDLIERIGGRGISTSTQVGIIAGGSFALIAVILALMYVIGLFL